MVHNPTLNNTLRIQRRWAYAALYGPPPPPTLTPTERLANTFGNLALSRQLSSPDDAFVPANGVGGVSLLERRVEHAFTAVLGPIPGRGPQAVIRALNGAFPVMNGTTGPVARRSVVSLYSPQSDGARESAGLAGQLSAAQANLYRQASLLVDDALRVLGSLDTLSDLANPDQVEALSTVARQQFETIAHEFGRVGEPREERVANAFAALDSGTSGTLPALRGVALLTPSNASITLTDELLIASFDLLTGYVTTLRQLWVAFLAARPPFNVLTNLPLVDRLARASVMLPLIEGGNRTFLSVLETVGFTDAERRSEGARLIRLDPAQLLPAPPLTMLPRYTLAGLTDWIERFTTIEGPSLLASAEQDGFDATVDQAHILFMVLSTVVTEVRAMQAALIAAAPIPVMLTADSALALALADERVSRILDDLVFQVLTLADLAA
jgi:hypothetical protein